MSLFRPPNYQSVPLLIVRLLLIKGLTITVFIEQAKKTFASDLQRELHDYSTSDSEEDRQSPNQQQISVKEELLVEAEVPEQAEYPPEPAIQRRQFPKNVETVGVHELVR